MFRKKMALNGAQLIQIKKNSTGSVIDVTTNCVTIGSDVRCDIRIHKSNVERKHCVIKRKGSKVLLFNYSSTSPVLVNDVPVLCNKELLSNDIITISNRKFLWSNNDTLAKTNYSRFSTSQVCNSLVKEYPGPLRDLVCHTVKNRSSLPVHSRRSRSEVVTEKQVAMVKPVQPDVDESTSEEPILPHVPRDAALKHKAEILTKRFRSRSLNIYTAEVGKPIHQTRQSLRPSSRRLMETTSLMRGNIKSEKNNILDLSSNSTNKIERKLSRKSFLTRMSKVEKLAHKNSALEIKSVKRVAVKRKLGDQEINTCNKKRKISQDAKNTTSRILKNSFEQPDVNDMYPDHAYSMVIPKKFKFGESRLLGAHDVSGRISQEQNIGPSQRKSRSSIIGETFQEKDFTRQSKCPELNISITENGHDNTRTVLETSNAEIGIDAATQNDVEAKSILGNLDGIDNLTANKIGSQTMNDLAEIEEYSDGVDNSRTIDNESIVEEHSSTQPRNGMNNQSIISPILISIPQDYFQINETFPQTVLKRCVLRNSVSVFSTNESNQVTNIKKNSETMENSNANMSINSTQCSPTSPVKNLIDQTSPTSQHSANFNEIFSNSVLKKDATMCSISMLSTTENDLMKNITMEDDNPQINNNSNVSESVGHNSASPGNITYQMTSISQHTNKLNETFPKSVLKRCQSLRRSVSMIEKGLVNKETTTESHLSSVEENYEIISNSNGNDSNLIDQISVSQHSSKCNETCPKIAMERRSLRSSITSSSLLEKATDQDLRISQHSIKIHDISSKSMPKRRISKHSISVLPETEHDKNNKENFEIIDMSNDNSTEKQSSVLPVSDITRFNETFSQIKKFTSTPKNNLLRMPTFVTPKEHSVNNDTLVSNGVMNNSTLGEDNEGNIKVIENIIEGHGPSPLNSKNNTSMNVMRRSARINGTLEQDLNTSSLNNTIIIPKSASGMPVNENNQMDKNAHIETKQTASLEDNLSLQSARVKKLQVHGQTEHKIMSFPYDTAFRKSKSLSNILEISDISNKIMKDVALLNNKTSNHIYNPRSLIVSTTACAESPDDNDLIFSSSSNKRSFNDMLDVSENNSITIQSEKSAYGSELMTSNKFENDVTYDIERSQFSIADISGISLLQQDISNKDSRVNASSNIVKNKSVNTSQEISMNISISEAKTQAHLQNTFTSFNTSTPRNQKSSSVSINSSRNEANFDSIDHNEPAKIELADVVQETSIEISTVRSPKLGSKDAAHANDILEQKSEDVELSKTHMNSSTRTPRSVNNSSANFMLARCTRSSNRILKNILEKSSKANLSLPLNFESDMNQNANPNSKIINSDFSCSKNEVASCLNRSDDSVTYNSKINQLLSSDVNIPVLNTNDNEKETNDKTPESNTNYLIQNTMINYESTPISSIRRSGRIENKSDRITDMSKTALYNAADSFRSDICEDQGSETKMCSDEQSVTPKTTVRLVTEVVKKQHSTAKKATPRHTLGPENMHPLSIISNKSRNDIHNASNINTRSSKILKLSNNVSINPDELVISSSESQNEEKVSKSAHLKLKMKGKLARSSNKSPKNDLSDTPSQKRILSPKNDLSDVSGVKFIMGTSSINLYEEISEIEQSMKENTSGANPMITLTETTNHKVQQFSLKSLWSDECFDIQTLFDLEQYETKQNSVDIDESFDNLISKPIIKKTYFNRGKTLSPIKKINRSKRLSLDCSLHNQVEIENWLQNSSIHTINKEQTGSIYSADKAYLKSQVTDDNNGISVLIPEQKIIEIVPELSDALLSESQVMVISNRRPLYTLKQDIFDDGILEDVIVEPVIVEQKYDHPAFTPTHMLKKDKRAIDLDIKYLIGTKSKFKKTRRVHNKKSDEQNSAKISDIRIQKCFVLLHRIEPAGKYDELSLFASQNKSFRTNIKVMDSFDCDSASRENTVITSAKQLKDTNIKEIQITNSKSRSSTPARTRRAIKNMEEKEEVMIPLTRPKEFIGKNVAENITNESAPAKRTRRVLRNLETSDKQEKCLATETTRITRRGLKKLNSSEEPIGRQINAAGVENESLVEIRKQTTKEFASENKSENEASSSSTVSAIITEKESLIETPIKRTRRAIRNAKNSGTSDYEQTAAGTNNEVKSMMNAPVKRTRRVLVNIKNVEVTDCERNKPSDVGNITTNDDNGSSVKKSVRRNRIVLSKMNNSGTLDLGKIDSSCISSVTKNDEKRSPTKQLLNQNRKEFKNIKNSHVPDIEKIDISNTSALFIKIDQKEPMIKKPITRNRRMLGDIKDSDVPDVKNIDVSSARMKIDEKEPVKRSRRVLNNMKNSGKPDLEIADISCRNTITTKVNEKGSSVKKPTKRDRKVLNNIEDSDVTDFKNIDTSSASKKIDEKEPSVKPLIRNRRALSNVKDSDILDLENAFSSSTKTFATKIVEKESSVKKPLTRSKRVLSNLKIPDMPEFEKIDASKVNVAATKMHAKELLVKPLSKRIRKEINDKNSEDPICPEPATTTVTAKNAGEESLIKPPVKRNKCALRNVKSLDETDEAVEDNNSAVTKLKRNVKKTEARNIEEQQVKGPQTRSKRNK